MVDRDIQGIDKEEWVTIPQASRRINRAASTVAGWLKNEKKQISKYRRKNRWYVELGSVIRANRTSVDGKARYIRYEAELRSEVCPKCGGSNWIRNGYNDMSKGDVSILLYCKDEICHNRWSLRLTQDSDILLKRKRNNNGVKRFRKRNNDIEVQIETEEELQASRKSYVRGFIEDGLNLRKVLEVFGPSIRNEIRGYYYEIIEEKQKE